MRANHLLLLGVLLVGGAISFPLGVIASHQFTDVPDSNTFHDDIDAIRDAGVTTGCATNLYCPKDFVTREQMAAFLNRLGALQAGKTPVVNADRVDGYQAGSLGIVVSARETVQTLIGPGETEITYGTVEITAPVAGYVLVTAATTLRNTDCLTDCVVIGRLYHNEIGLDALPHQVSVAYDGYSSLSSTAVFKVEPGVNTFRLLLGHWPDADGDLYGYWGELTAHFTPFAGVIRQ